MDEIRDNYTFRQIVQTDDVDAGGAVRKTLNEEREVFFVNGRRVGRLVKKNGAELSASEQKSEEARVTKLVENYVKSSPLKGSAGRVSFVALILSLAKVSNPRRIPFNGRDTLVFDFTGDPDAHAHGTNESAVKKLAGTVWIDDADRQVARVEARFYDTFRLGGFLASVQKGTHMEIQQAPVGDGLWMQTSIEQHLALRVVVAGLHKNVTMRNSDFRKFDVGMLQQTKPPGPATK